MRVVVSPYNVVTYPQGGGHFWVYMQYVAGLRNLGYDVWWLEEFWGSGDSQKDAILIAALVGRLRQYGLEERLILFSARDGFLNISPARARSIFSTSDLLLNFHQRMPAWILGQFRRTALVDIDPGLLQYWMSSGDLVVSKHDLYFTTGETVGKPEAKIPDCGVRWIPIRPPVSLDLWPFVLPPKTGSFTTISGWWGNEWVTDGDGTYDNNKRSAFLPFADLPAHTRVPLELALALDPSSSHDEEDRQSLSERGWRIRRSHEVAGTPKHYQTYIQASRGEFSCAKASCMKFQNAWVSDRTLCYLATGRPVVVQNTGPSSILPNGIGLFRFSTLEEAAAGLEEIDANYSVHSRAARELAEFFDARRVAETIVGHCARTGTGQTRSA